MTKPLRRSRDIMKGIKMNTLSEQITDLAVMISTAYRKSQLIHRTANHEHTLLALLVLPMMEQLSAINEQLSHIVSATEDDRNEQVVKLCQAFAHPGCEPGKHELASKILVLFGDRSEVR